MRKTSKGFTMIELLVVIAIIGILTTISVISYSRLQTSARDSQRSSKLTVIAEALEKYYTQNGEYPSCTDMTQSANTVATTTLTGVDTTNLTTPSASSGANSFVCTDPIADNFGYVGGGTQYTLEYRSENTGALVTYDSRHSFAIATGPSTPTIAVTLSGGNVIATASVATCTSPAIPQYQFKTRSNDGSWSDYSAWATSQTASQPAVDGVKYGYQVQSRCYLGNNSFSASATSAEGIYIDPITTPSVPSVNLSTPDASTTYYSWPAVSCPANTSIYYRYRFVVNYSGGYTSPWYGTTYLTEALTTSAEGYQYTGQAQAQCSNTNIASAWSGTGQSSYLRPVSVPSNGITFTSWGSGDRHDLWYPTYLVQCNNGATVYSTDDTWLPSGDPSLYWYPWRVAAGWYYDVGGIMDMPWGNYGTSPTWQIHFGIGYGSNLQSRIRVKLKCVNTVTGVQSGETGFIYSQYFNAPVY